MYLPRGSGREWESTAPPVVSTEGPTRQRYSLHPSPEGLHGFLATLAKCPPGKGNVTPPKVSQASRDAFNTCRAHGWVEEVQSGNIRIWKITPVGRAALRPHTGIPSFFSHNPIAEA